MQADGSAILSFGKHAGLTFAHVAQHHQGYCDWVLGLWDCTTGQMLKFQSYLRRVYAPVKAEQAASRQMVMKRFQLEKDAEDAERRRVHEARVRESEKRAREAKELTQKRMRTSRPEQLLGLAGDASFFHEFLHRMGLWDLLKMPLVCKELQAAVLAQGDGWFKLLARKAIAANTDKWNVYYANAVKKLFGMPRGWRMAVVPTDATLVEAWIAELVRTRRLSRDQREEYTRVREALRLAIGEWDQTSGAFTKAIMNTQILQKDVDAVLEAKKRMQAAVDASSVFLKKHKFPVTVPGRKLDRSTICRWKEIATQTQYDLCA